MMKFSPLLRRTCVRLLLLATCVSLLGACSTLNRWFDTGKNDYQKSATERPLEVPPGLSSPTQDTSMDIPGAGAAGTAGASGIPGAATSAGASSKRVLPPIKGIRVARDGDERWLVIDAPPDRVWPRVREFWLNNGFVLAQEDPQVGVMETNWAENRADIPEGPIRSLISKVLPTAYSAPTRDRFRVRIEPGAQPGTTDLYLTQRGVKEVAQGDSFVWEVRPPDPGLEAEMLRRLMVFLGVQEAQAKSMVAGAASAPPRAELVKDASGDLSLTVQDGFANTWRRTGIALDRVGFLVQSQDRAKGLYQVRYDNAVGDQGKPGLLSRLFDFGRSESHQYQIQVQGQPGAEQSRVVVLNTKGERENSKTAHHILTLLQEQLR